MSARGLSLPAPLNQWRVLAHARWKALSLRERQAMGWALAVVVLFLVWTVAVAPAWRTLQSGPVQLDRLDAQVQHMQLLAAEARNLRSTPPVSTVQSAAALKAASDHLGDRARLTLLGDRATLTLTGLSGERLRQWLAEARSGARARVVEAQLSRGPQGYSGTLVLSLSSTSGGS